MDRSRSHNDSQEAESDGAAGRPLRALIVEDSADDCELLTRQLRRAGYYLSYERVERAEEIYAAYLAAPQGQVVLHGDFHHENVLAGTRLPWLIIDPKGLVGEPAYEVGAFLRNYLLDKPDPKAVLERRVDIFVDRLGFESERILNWGLAVNVLSAWWSVEDHGHGWEGAMEVAKMCDELGSRSGIHR